MAEFQVYRFQDATDADPWLHGSYLSRRRKDGAWSVSRDGRVWVKPAWATLSDGDLCVSMGRFVPYRPEFTPHTDADLAMALQLARIIRVESMLTRYDCGRDSCADCVPHWLIDCVQRELLSRGVK